MAYNKVEKRYSQMVAAIGGSIFTGIQSIEYSDSVEKTANWGAGARPVSRSYGKYEAKAKLGLHMSEVEVLQALAPNGDITQIAPFDITVTFPATSGTSYTINKLRGCEFLGNMRSMKVDDGMFVVELDLIVDSIDWK